VLDECNAAIRQTRSLAGALVPMRDGGLVPPTHSCSLGAVAAQDRATKARHPRTAEQTVTTATSQIIVECGADLASD
jgi:hypothetical protein